MRKNLLVTFALASLTGSMLAQLPVSTAPSNKKAVLEEFTGIHCGYCPDGHRIGTQIYNADPNNVVLINIHSGSFANAAVGEPDFKTPEGTAIDVMPGMGITGYPAGTMNREILSGSVMAGSRSLWTSWASTIKSQPAYCNVALQGTLDPQTRVLTVQVEVYYTANSPVATNSLNVFLLEDKIPGIQSNYGTPLYNIANYNADGTYNHNHVLRKAITPTFGQTISNTTLGSLYTTTLTYTVPATYGASGKTTTPKFENLELVAFVTQTDRKIINGDDGPVYMINDAAALALNVPAFTCGSSVSPTVTVKNNGITAITALTITPSIDGVAANTTNWVGNLATGASTTIALNSITSSTGGGHLLTYTITGVSNNDFYLSNNSGSGNFYVASGYQGTPIAEPFATASFPPPSWGKVNANGGPSWSRMNNVGAFAILPFGSMKYDFFNNTVIGDMDEMLLPPIDLSGSATPSLSFDLSKAFRASENDQLDVMVSTDCGANWVSVYAKAGAALAVYQSPVASNYFPTNFTEWRTEEVALTGFNNASVLVKFVATNDHGNNMFIDNINLSQSVPTGIKQHAASNYMVELYPNPSNGETKISINALHATKASISIVNALGQNVYHQETDLISGNNELSFDASRFASGIYSVIVESSYGSAVKKLSID